MALKDIIFVAILCYMQFCVQFVQYLTLIGHGSSMFPSTFNLKMLLKIGWSALESWAHNSNFDFNICWRYTFPNFLYAITSTCNSINIFVLHHIQCSASSPKITSIGASSFTPGRIRASIVTNCDVRFSGWHVTVMLQYFLLQVPLQPWSKTEVDLKHQMCGVNRTFSFYWIETNTTWSELKICLIHNRISPTRTKFVKNFIVSSELH